MHRSLAPLVSLVLLLSAGLVYGEETQTENARAAYALSRELMSPYCPGRTLADCPSPPAAALREEIRERIEGGASQEEIRRDLENRFGSAVRGTPSGAWGWALPGFVLAAGAVALALALMRLTRRRAGLPEDEAIPPDLERELREELRDLGP
jgi:cytochrome c-type biogenesis protein CcmH